MTAQARDTLRYAMADIGRAMSAGAPAEQLLPTAQLAVDAARLLAAADWPEDVIADIAAGAYARGAHSHVHSIEQLCAWAASAAERPARGVVAAPPNRLWRRTEPTDRTACSAAILQGLLIAAAAHTPAERQGAQT